MRRLTRYKMVDDVNNQQDGSEILSLKNIVYIMFFSVRTLIVWEMSHDAVDEAKDTDRQVMTLWN